MSGPYILRLILDKEVIVEGEIRPRTALRYLNGFGVGRSMLWCTMLSYDENVKVVEAAFFFVATNRHRCRC